MVSWALNSLGPRGVLCPLRVCIAQVLIGILSKNVSVVVVQAVLQCVDRGSDAQRGEVTPAEWHSCFGAGGGGVWRHGLYIPSLDAEISQYCLGLAEYR